MKHVTVFWPLQSVITIVSRGRSCTPDRNGIPAWFLGRAGAAGDNCFVESLEGNQKTGRVIRGNVKRYVSLIDTNRQRKGEEEGSESKRGVLIKFGLEPREKATTTVAKSRRS